MKYNTTLGLAGKDCAFVACAACRKCCNGCPAQINIPVVLNLYVQYLRKGESILEQFEKIDSVGKPLDCIECGACTACCPEKIDVKAIMRELAMQQCRLCSKGQIQ